MSVVAGVAPAPDAATPGTGRPRTRPPRSRGPVRRQAGTRPEPPGHLRAVAEPAPHDQPDQHEHPSAEPAAVPAEATAPTERPRRPGRRATVTGGVTRRGGCGDAARGGVARREVVVGGSARGGAGTGAAAVGAGDRVTAARSAEVARGWRLTRRGRAVVLGLLVVLLTAGAVGFGAAQAIGASTAPTDRQVEVVVAEGDTLWSIAASVAPRGDRRETVQRIREANDLGNARIEPGQQLVVPVGTP